ncbi:MAG: SIR2 family protein [Bacteroidales bacterium]|nr:SIR2 family protein [Bacteroidales bacterium]
MEKRELEAFIKSFVKDLSENNVAIFAGAGMSREAGCANWPELLREIADELGLSVDKEYDLISLAQYHVNEKKNRHRIKTKILEEFADVDSPTKNHKILARLPITTYWTTNYDTLIEDALSAEYRIVDMKHEVKQLTHTRPKRDAVVYKMHGDVNHPDDAILTKQQYEEYYKTHESFIATLSGDLITKTFLFIGFSFTDPNLAYVLSRMNIQFGEGSRQHYCFLKKEIKEAGDDIEIFKYKKRKQELMINDLRRYKVETILVDEYSDITDILLEIERRYKKKTIFISGSAEEYGHWSREEAQNFIHLLSKSIVTTGYRVVSGFGWGVGSAVINGALDAVYENLKKSSEDQLVIKPFPQFRTGDKELSILWEEYRQRMMSLCGIAIFVFGNKKNESDKIVDANGMKREFEIAVEQGLVPIPLPVTGYMSRLIFDVILSEPEKFLLGETWILKELEKIGLTSSIEEIITIVINIIKRLNR